MSSERKDGRLRAAVVAAAILAAPLAANFCAANNPTELDAQAEKPRPKSAELAPKARKEEVSLPFSGGCSNQPEGSFNKILDQYLGEEEPAALQKGYALALKSCIQDKLYEGGLDGQCNLVEHGVEAGYGGFGVSCVVNDIDGFPTAAVNAYAGPVCRDYVYDFDYYNRELVKDECVESGFASFTSNESSDDWVRNFKYTDGAMEEEGGLSLNVLDDLGKDGHESATLEDLEGTLPFVCESAYEELVNPMPHSQAANALSRRFEGAKELLWEEGFALDWPSDELFLEPWRHSDELLQVTSFGQANDGTDFACTYMWDTETDKDDIACITTNDPIAVIRSTAGRGTCKVFGYIYAPEGSSTEFSVVTDCEYPSLSIWD